MSSTAGDSQFHTTQWSLVVAAASPAGEACPAALAELCQAYWYPLYAFLRRRGNKAEDARDLTQSFFATLLEKGYLADADPERGRFRSFLLTAVARFAAKEHDRAMTQKRGGGRNVLSLDFGDGERRYLGEPTDDWTPERIFERRWALTLLDRTLNRLREDYSTQERQAQFDALKIFLTAESGAPPLREIAARLQITEGAVKVAIHRLRQRYRELLRAEIAQTVVATEDVDDELVVLLAALRGK